MNKETLMSSLERALSFRGDYNAAISDHHHALNAYRLSLDNLKYITVLDRLKTMIPEIVITVIFYIFAKDYPTTPLMWAIAGIGTCFWIYSIIIFFARTKKRFMKTKEYQSRLQASNEAHEVVNKMSENIRRIKMRMHGNVPFLSEQYIYPEALALLLEYLENGKANDLQETLNLYETETKHKEIMEANQRLEYEIQMLRNEVGSIYIPTTYH